MPVNILEQYFIIFPTLFWYYNEVCESRRHNDTVWAFTENIVQVYLFITRCLGSIKLDRVISETRYSDLRKGATNSSLIDMDFAITSASEHQNVNICQPKWENVSVYSLKSPPLILFWLEHSF